MYLYPRPKKIEERRGELILGGKVTLAVEVGLLTKSQERLIKELYKNFTCGVGKLTICEGERGVAVLASQQQTAKGSLGENEYAISIDQQKAAIFFNDRIGFMHAFYTLLSMIEERTVEGKLAFTLPICKIEDEPTVAFRGIHFCVFPETRYTMLKKFIRFAGFTKYTHVIIEFWGTFPYRCCPDMARKTAYTRKQIKSLVQEANDLGMEVVPMLNCLGHAAQNRALIGKHAALDQNPKLAPYFEPTGWTWNLLNPDIKILLKEMRKELVEICGEGHYFHIGCDEAFPYGTSRLFAGLDKNDILVEHINEIAKEMKETGRRVFIWSDQMLYRQPEWAPAPDNISYAESQEMADKLLSGLDKDIIVVDWQYYAGEKVMPTAKLLSESGFEVVLAPFDCLKGTKTCVNNVVENNYYGLMQTTWHLMHGARSDWEGSISMNLRSADMFWNGKTEHSKMDNEMLIFQTGAFYRKLLPPKGKYRDCGIRENEIET